MTFEHPTLQPDQHQIRLVQLHSSIFDKFSAQPTIHLTLSVANLDDKPRFKALSYTWGSPLPTKQIFINEQRFYVRENLWLFLQSAVSRGIREPLWIDQICINQAEIRERNHQVSLMSRIYTEANQVLMWLGPAAEESDLAMWWLKRISVRKSIWDPDPSWNSGWNIGKSRGRNPDITPMCIKYCKSRNAMISAIRGALKALLERPYWNRLWIVQEAILGTSPLVLCGARSIPSSQIVLFAAYWRVDPATYPIGHADRGTDTEFMAAVWRMMTVKATILVVLGNDGWAHPFDLHSALRLSRYCECSDIRDRVFGVLALVQHQERIEIDYSIPKERLMVQVLEHMVNREGIKSNIDVGECLHISKQLLGVEDAVLEDVAAAFGKTQRGIAPGILIDGMKCHNRETALICREIWAWVERNHHYGERIAEWLDRHKDGEWTDNDDSDSAAFVNEKWYLDPRKGYSWEMERQLEWRGLVRRNARHVENPDYVPSPEPSESWTLMTRFFGIHWAGIPLN